MPAIGVVIIGRNEGERLRRCLASLRGGDGTVYVDSGSTDRSVDLAHASGADVVELDMSTPFTMARGRNAGFEHLLARYPDIAFVQFVDGDCEVREGWLENGASVLKSRPEIGAVFGRLRERFPDATLYNRLCDMEWAGQPGEVPAFGGIVMIRVEALRRAGVYNPAMIAGEEAELSLRIRGLGLKILRLSEEMAFHDAAMTRFSQWWRRSTRTGHAYAEGAVMHARTAERYNLRPVLSSLAWGLILPLAALGAAWCTRGLSLLLLLAYALLWLRVRKHRLDRADPPRLASLYATFCVLAKFAQALGIVQYAWRRLLLRRPAKLIEYKDVASATAVQDGPARDLFCGQQRCVGVPTPRAGSPCHDNQAARCSSRETGPADAQEADANGEPQAPN